ncbi:MoaD/ThiS family protein [Paenarthrobacter sp. Z7-10]|uniref:MoaD/ThiS family protein n=1 Tax=Paenarthrobacter sp. Z7-10 TaxID=2787635 RepID=UPI0022A8E884|nr:MoaD/ThiS family protein [Paenarthrobacter sp. Z7-10]MCZ2401670.1 MoaD/ThiS family protein [Paenarthrobacter sp. Z7-10]
MPADVTVLVPSLLRQFTDGHEELRLSVDGPVTLAEMLDVLGAQYPIFNRRIRDETGSLRRYVNVYVERDDVRRLRGTATEVQPGQEVLIIQSVAGG